MIRVAICSSDARQRAVLRALVNRVADAKGIVNIHVLLAVSPSALEELISSKHAGHIDLAMYCIDDWPIDELDALRRIREQGSDVHMFLLSQNKDNAQYVYQLGNASLYAEPSLAEGLGDALARQMEAIAKQKSRSVCLKSTEGLDNVPVSELLFVETGKRGPLMHLPNGHLYELRGSLQSLFDQLSDGARFVRVGGSLIVNLDNVRAFSGGSVVFPDGEAIIVPVRTRQPLSDQLETYRMQNVTKGS